MNSTNINLHDYYIKPINLQNYTLTDISHFKVKLCKFYTFSIIHLLNALRVVEFVVSNALQYWMLIKTQIMR